MHILSLALGFLAAFPIVKAVDESVPAVKSDKLTLTSSVTFSGSDSGPRLVNGVPTKANITVTNSESTDVTAHLVGGSLHRPGSHEVIRNFTTRPVDLKIAPGESGTIQYSFTNEIFPQDVYLHLFGVFMSDENSLDRITLFNDTATIIEVPLDVFDPQMFFLYLFVSAVLGGAGYFIYKTWVAPLIPARRRKPFVKRRPAPNPNATATGPVIDKSWIPKHHLPSQQTRGKRGKQPKQEKQT